MTTQVNLRLQAKVIEHLLIRSNKSDEAWEELDTQLLDFYLFSCTADDSGEVKGYLPSEEFEVQAENHSGSAGFMLLLLTANMLEDVYVMQLAIPYAQSVMAADTHDEEEYARAAYVMGRAHMESHKEEWAAPVKDTLPPLSDILTHIKRAAANVCEGSHWETRLNRLAAALERH
jgi:hypothetical protein